jgi:hypothetical protein
MPPIYEIKYLYLTEWRGQILLAIMGDAHTSIPALAFPVRTLNNRRYLP